MKINTDSTYKYLLKMLEKHLDDVTISKNNSSTTPTDKQTIPESQKNSPSHEVLNLLKQFNEQEKRTLITTWVNNKLPLDINTIKKLIAFLNENGTGNKNQTADNSNNNISKIKAFAFMVKNNITLSKGMLNGLTANFNQHQSISKQLNTILHSTNITEVLSDLFTNGKIENDNGNINLMTNINQQLEQTTSNQSLSRPFLQLLRNLIIIPDQSPDSPSDLQLQLENYPEKLNQSLQIIQEQGDGATNKIFQQLTGQHLINQQDNNLLLQLELPLYFPQYKKLIPAYLQVKRQKRGNKNQPESKKDNYHISFIIALEKRGMIKADVLLSPGRVKAEFTCNQNNTTRLVKKHFPSLKTNLEKMGFMVEEPVIEEIEKGKESEEINRFLYQSIDNNANDNDLQEFIHIDLKI